MNENDNKLKIKGLSPYSVIPESANIRPKTGIAYNLPEISVTPQNNPQTAPLTATDVKNKQTLISNINRAQNTAGQTGYNAIDTAMGFTNPLWGLASGVAHGGLALKDIKDNGLTWSNALNAGLGIGMLGTHLSPFAQEITARTSGVLDTIKYGIKDRIQGYNLYNKYLKGNITNIQDQLQDFRFNNGWISTSDKTGNIFLQPATYTRSEVINSGPTSMRMGFQAVPGQRLSRDLVLQGKKSIDKLPAGTSISADSHGISIPSRLSKRKGQSNITKTLFEGTEDANTTLSRLERNLGETFHRNPYDMSADAHRFFTLEAQKPGRQLVYAGRSGKWNNAAVSNPQVYKWQEAYDAGRISAKEYVDNYNNWVKEFGGRPGHVDLMGRPYFYHPTIFVTHKSGGKIIERFKNRNRL